MAVPAPRTGRDHELLFRHQSCRCISSPVASRRPRNRLDRSRHPCRPCGAGSPPAATDNARMAARRANRQTQRGAHRPHPRSRSAPDSPRATAYRPLARMPQDTPGAVTQHRRRRDRRKPTAAPDTPRPRTAPAAAVPSAPLALPRRTRRGRPPRREQPAPAPKHDQRRSGILPSSDRGAGHPPAGRPCRSVASRRRAAPGPRDTASARSRCPSRRGSGPTARRGPARSAAPNGTALSNIRRCRLRPVRRRPLSRLPSGLRSSATIRPAWTIACVRRRCAPRWPPPSSGPRAPPGACPESPRCRAGSAAA